MNALQAFKLDPLGSRLQALAREGFMGAAVAATGAFLSALALLRLRRVSGAHRWAHDTVTVIDVVLQHPHGHLRVGLQEWISKGPGDREFLAPTHAIERETGKELPLSVVPLRYRNSPWSRRLVRLRLLKEPWPSQR